MFKLLVCFLYSTKYYVIANCIFKIQWKYPFCGTTTKVKKSYNVKAILEVFPLHSQDQKFDASFQSMIAVIKVLILNLGFELGSFGQRRPIPISVGRCSYQFHGQLQISSKQLRDKSQPITYFSHYCFILNDTNIGKRPNYIHVSVVSHFKL